MSEFWKEPFRCEKHNLFSMDDITECPVCAEMKAIARQARNDALDEAAELCEYEEDVKAILALKEE